MSWIGAGFVMTFGSLPGQTIFIAQFNLQLRDTFSLSHGEFGGIYTLGTIASSILLIWAGGAVDKYAPKLLATICLIGLALVSLGMTQISNIFMLGLVIFGLRFFGQGMMGLIAMTAMSRWFARFRGRALSLAQMGGATGEAMFPLLTTLAIVAFGWRQVWVAAAGFLVLGLVPLIWYLLRHSPGQYATKSSDNKGLEVENNIIPTGRKWVRYQVVRDPVFWLIVSGFMAPWAINTLFVFHQAHLSVIKGWDLVSFTAFFPVLSITVVLVSFGAGMLVDRFGAWRLLPFYLVPQAIGCIALSFLDPLWAVPIVFVFFGTTMGTSAPLVGALLTELYGTAHVGAIRALATSFMVLASAIGPGMAGGWIDVGFELEGQALLYAAYCFGLSALFVLTRAVMKKRVMGLV